MRQEAYDRTGRIVNITITPTVDSKEAPRLLNYLTAPNVVRAAAHGRARGLLAVVV